MLPITPRRCFEACRKCHKTFFSSAKKKVFAYLLWILAIFFCFHVSSSSYLIWIKLDRCFYLRSNIPSIYVILSHLTHLGLDLEHHCYFQQAFKHSPIRDTHTLSLSLYLPTTDCWKLFLSLKPNCFTSPLPRLPTIQNDDHNKLFHWNKLIWQKHLG